MRRIVALAAAAGLLVALLAVAQLVLPGIAARRIREQLSKSGTVLDVEVSAFPAVELLWHHADSVTVRMASYRSGNARLSSLLAQSGDAGSVDAFAGVMTDGLLTLHDAQLHKRGNSLRGSAQVDERDLRRAISLIRSVRPIASSAGALTLQGTAELPILGPTTVPFVVAVRNGALVVAPDVPVVGSLLTLRLFSDPHVYVQAVSAADTPGGFRVSARATLR